MTPLDNVSQIHSDIVPAWLRTLRCDFLNEGYSADGRDDQKTWRGELYLRGKIRRFSANDEGVDRSLKRLVSDTPVLVGTQLTPVSSQVADDVLTLSDLALMKPGVPLSVAQCLYREGSLEHALIEYAEQLMGLIAALKTPLRDFLIELFSDAEIVEAFVTSSASHKHHHAKPGGLLIHSVDCALMVKRLAGMRMGPSEAEVSTVAALLHDIGKTRTHAPSRSQNVMGQCVSHESIGIEILAPYLKALDEKWETGAHLLRHMLGWDRTGHRFPAFPGTLLVKMCDQFDTALDLRHQSFEGKPSWYGYAMSEGGAPQRFVRIPS